MADMPSIDESSESNGEVIVSFGGVKGTEAESCNTPDATTTAATEEEEENPIKVSQIFNDPTSNVVFKTSDNVLFRVDDFYLKANR
ncbi:hypothetical protein QFC19_000110 [Naganishia cerealis]|uniref:Uncharacterized protein n=1 Tax=Naganishia cerealis TaxID=610337 RepID=A0ACC2WR91_9TREE|nr:hypothetical protein QFC19_000110 [Naganishia cerealis]